VWKGWVFAYRARCTLVQESAAPIYVKIEIVDTISSSLKLILKISKKQNESSCKVCHGRFHDILPKEYSRTFPELPWGLQKRCILTTGVIYIL